MADLDHEALEQHHITARDIENVRRYVAILQGMDSQAYADIVGGCYYGTSALLHEVVEIRILLGRDRRLLTRSRQEIKAFLQDNGDAHVQGLIVEYPYLQRKIAEASSEQVDLGALIKANSSSLDYDRLVESELPMPIFEPTEQAINHAIELLERLKEVDKEAHG